MTNLIFILAGQMRCCCQRCQRWWWTINEETRGPR